MREKRKIVKVLNKRVPWGAQNYIANRMQTYLSTWHVRGSEASEETGKVNIRTRGSLCGLCDLVTCVAVCVRPVWPSVPMWLSV
jgi:hypothetical protein